MNARTGCLLLAVVVVTGCGRSMLEEGDDAPPLGQDQQPLCGATEQPPQVPLTRDVQSDQPVRWPRGPCLTVTYDARLASALPVIDAALAQWSAPTCTWLCFEKPVAVTEAPASPALRSIHFRGPGPDDQPEYLTLSNITFTQKTGEIRFAVPMVRPERLTAPQSLHVMGHVLGFGSTDTDSVLNVQPTRATLSALDLQSVCAVYPVCADGQKGR